MTKLHFAMLPCALLFAGVLGAQSIDIQVELTNQIGTDVNRAGDLVSGRVVSPANLQGDFVEGKITESKSGAKLGGKSAFSFTFETLRHGNAAIAINSQFKSATNSKGAANVDEEGRIVRRASGNVAKVAGGTGAGALLGGLTRGAKGAAIGAAIGAGASIVLVQIAADGPNIRFAPGSRIVIEAQARGGSPLASLAPSQPAAAAVASAAAPAAPAAAAPAPAAPAAAAQPQDPAPATDSSASTAQPEMTVLKSAFVPGEKTIFFDDFTDMSAGDAPPHFKVRGTAPELREGGGVRQLSYVSRGSMFPNLTGLPKNFTYEAEIKVDAAHRYTSSTLILFSKGKQIFDLKMHADTNVADLVACMRAPYAELGRKHLTMDWSRPAKLDLWIQNGRLRVFMNGEKQLDFNQVEMPPLDSVEIANEVAANVSLGYRTVRFAESTPDFSQVIGSSGRYVTHGILFDTDSDRLKPESAPVIQAIAQGLTANSSLKLLIEGHTDSSGNAAHNLDLSKRRAEAVKTVLATQFKIDPARLTSAGLGATKPIDSNDTPMGRSQNRRVEFVKQ